MKEKKAFHMAGGLGDMSYSRNSSLKEDMKEKKAFHMAGGLGDMSYSRNSGLQKNARETVDYITRKVVLDIYLKKFPECLKIADLGCSSGLAALSLVKEIAQEIDEACHSRNLQVPEIHMFLNDLPTSDFNSIFVHLPDYICSLPDKCKTFSSVYIAGVAGSFYGRLFPKNSLHVFHSSYCLHWLSQVPPGLFDKNVKPIEKGKIYISADSPGTVLNAYKAQFQKDFSLFLRSRSVELVPGGQMVLILTGRRTTDLSDRAATFLWDLLAEAFTLMVSEGKVEEEKVDSYKTHFYGPSMEEMEEEIKKEGSFVTERSGMFDGATDASRWDPDTISKTVRAIQGPRILDHFGEGISERLFQIYANLLRKKMVLEYVHAVNLLLVLKKAA